MLDSDDSILFAVFYRKLSNTYYLLTEFAFRTVKY